LATILSTETVRKWTSRPCWFFCPKSLPENRACGTFLIGINDLTWMAESCAHCFPQFMCTASQPCAALPKKAAWDFFPCRSRTSPFRDGLAHNLFHTICEETQARQAGPATASRARLYSKRNAGCPAGCRGRRTRDGARACLKFGLALLSPMESRTWMPGAQFAHIVFHSLCAKSRNNRRPRPVRHIDAECQKLVQEKFSLINQATCIRYLRLRTILSTQNVQKPGSDRPATARHAASFFSSKISS
jgi:hypothetical protein